MLAGGVGVIGGLVNICFYYATESVSLLFLRRPGEVVEVAEKMVPWQRVLTPTLGGLCAGLVLYWGLRMAGPLRSSNLLEVIVAGDGRLPFRSGAGEVPLVAGDHRLGGLDRAGGGHRAIGGDAGVQMGPAREVAAVPAAAAGGVRGGVGDCGGLQRADFRGGVCGA